jgi:acetoin utilization deacetylase AcuC-like enzyme
MLLITHPKFLAHEMGPGHPEQPARLTSIDSVLRQAPWFAQLAQMEARPASDEQLMRAHTEYLLQEIEAAAPERGYAALDPDTVMNPQTLEVIRLAAGAGVLAVNEVMSGRQQRAFCAVRPPGHHAERARAMGFCFYNNIAVAAYHALEAHGLKRVLVIDFDVHHGNGTENIFADDERVMMLSTFQSPFYPYSGTQPLGANMYNVPLAQGAGGTSLKQAVEGVWQLAIDEFKPEMIFVSAGFDAHHLDTLGGLSWRKEDYAWVSQWIVKQANKYSQGRIVSMLEGGYHLGGLAESACAHVEAML